MGAFDLDFTDTSSQGELVMSTDEILNLGGKSEQDNENNITNHDNDSNGNSDISEKNLDELELSIEDIVGKDDSDIKVEDEDRNVNPSSAKKETNNNSFLLLHNALAEEGILDEIGEDAFNEIAKEAGGGGKALLQVISSKLQNIETSIKNEYDADYQQFLKLKEAGINSDEAFNLVNLNSKLESISDDILEESEDVRKEILEMHFKNTTNWGIDRINKHVSKLIESGEDIDEAKDALPELKKVSKDAILNREKEERDYYETIKKQQEEATKNIRDTVVANAEIVKNIKLTKAQAIKAQELLLTPIELEDGSVTNILYAERIKNPLEFDKKLAALIAAGAFEGNVTSTKTSKKEALDTLEKALRDNTSKSFKANMEANREVYDEEQEVINDRFLKSIGAKK